MAKVIYNDIIPFKGFQAITILPFIFARNSVKPLKDYVVNHESIHIRQQFEVLVLSFILIFTVILVTEISWWWLLASPFVFFVWYGIEWLVRFAIYRDTHMAYRNIAFEQEAYNNQYDMEYPDKRRILAWVKYIGKSTYNKR